MSSAVVPMMFETSHSRKEKAERCLEAWFDHYVLNLSEPSSQGAEQGKVTHSALQNLVNEMKRTGKLIKSTARDVKAYTEKACEEHLTPGLHPKNVLDTLSPMVRYGLLGFDPADYVSVETEKPFEIVIDAAGHTIRGVMDLVLVRYDGVIVIVDYKSRLLLEAEGNPQLAVYALAARSWGYKAENIQCAFKFLAHKDLRLTSFSDDFLDFVLDEFRQHVADIDRRLVIGKDAFPAKPGWYCEWCSYSGICSKKQAGMELPVSVEQAIQQVQALGEQIMVAESFVSKAKALLKGVVERTGPVEVNGEWFDMWPTESLEYTAKDVFSILTAHGIDPFTVLKIDVRALERHLYGAFADELLMTAEPIVRRNFGHKSEPPAAVTNVDNAAASDAA